MVLSSPISILSSATSRYILNRVTRLLWVGGSIASALLAIILGLLYVKQDSLLYFPEIGGMGRSNKTNPNGYRSPSEHELPFEEHMIPCNFHHSTHGENINPKTAQGAIHSWLLLHQDESKLGGAVPIGSKKVPTLIFFHGNAGNIGHRIPNAKNYYYQLKSNILMVEYRGFGDSSEDSGRPTEQGLKNDAEAVLHYARSLPQIDPNRIFLFGQSLGGAVALHLAQYAESRGIPFAGVIVENTFLSISKMVDILMPHLKTLKLFVLRLRWDNEQIVSQGIRTPILFLAGEKDELVPHSHMKRLYELSCNGDRRSVYPQFHAVKGGRHNDMWVKGGKMYYDAMFSFMTHVLLHSPSSMNECNNHSTEISRVKPSSIEVDMGGGIETERMMPTTLKIFMNSVEDKKKVH